MTLQNRILNVEHPENASSSFSRTAASNPSVLPSPSSHIDEGGESRGADHFASALNDFTRKKLVQLLDSVSGKKGLVLDPKVSGPLSLVAEFSLLKERGVEKVYHLEGTGPLYTSCEQLIYICRPTPHNMKCIASQLKHFESGKNNISSSSASTAIPNSSSISSSPNLVYIFFSPRRSTLCERILEELGVYGQIKGFGEFPFDLVPLEEDLFSIQWENAFRELYVDANESCLFYLSKSILKLVNVMKAFKVGASNCKIIGRGQYSKRLCEIMLKLNALQDDALQSSGEVGDLFNLNSAPGNVASNLESIILIDRNVDLITPFCTPLTYEGLIDHIFGIKNTLVELDPKVSGISDAKKFSLTNSKDGIFEQIRDCNFSNVGASLSRLAKQVAENLEERHAAKSVSQLKAFVTKLGSLQSQQRNLKLHTNLTEELIKQISQPEFDDLLELEQNTMAGNDDHNQVMEALEEMISKSGPTKKIYNILRIMIIASQVQRGFRPKFYDQLRRDIIQTFGFNHFLTLSNLESANMIYKNDSGRNVFSVLRKQLNLIVEGVDEAEPDDISYVFSGYAPLSVRLIEHSMLSMMNGGGGVVGGSRQSNPAESSKGIFTSFGVGGGGKSPSSSAALSTEEITGLKGWHGSSPLFEQPLNPTGNNIQSKKKAASLHSHSHSQINHLHQLNQTDNQSTTTSTSKKSDRKQPINNNSSNNNVNDDDDSTTTRVNNYSRSYSIICYVGGVTISEVAALRYLATKLTSSSSNGGNRRFIVLSTGIENSVSLINSMMD